MRMSIRPQSAKALTTFVTTTDVADLEPVFLLFSSLTKVNGYVSYVEACHHARLVEVLVAVEELTWLLKERTSRCLLLEAAEEQGKTYNRTIGTPAYAYASRHWYHRHSKIDWNSSVLKVGRVLLQYFVGAECHVCMYIHFMNDVWFMIEEHFIRSPYSYWRHP